MSEDRLQWAHDMLGKMWEMGEVVHVDLVWEHPDDPLLQTAAKYINEAMDCIRAAARIIEMRQEKAE